MMNSKRKDAKGRLLRNGESQRQDGMYMYRFVDAEGVRRTIYSWRLVATDALPAGKRNGLPLRELEKQYKRDAEDGISSFAAKTETVASTFAKFLEQKKGLKRTTQSAYLNFYNIYIKDELGRRNIASVKRSDIGNFYLALIEDKHLSASTLLSIDVLVRQIFDLAVLDNLIRQNPAQGVYGNLKREYDMSKGVRHALTEEQQECFVDYVKTSHEFAYYLNIITVFLGTGCRVSEIAGLRWEDCDFNRGTISINHSLVYYKSLETGKMRQSITSTKSRAGVRTIQMMKDVREALLDERKKQMLGAPNNNEVDGYTGFVFQTKRGRLYYPSSIDQTLKCIVREYNRKEKTEAAAENREANLLPHISVHSLRHTFCTRFCEHESDLKVIQTVMGHANIAVTMDVYNEVTEARKKTSLANLEGKMKIR